MDIYISGAAYRNSGNIACQQSDPYHKDTIPTPDMVAWNRHFSTKIQNEKDGLFFFALFIWWEII